MHSAQAFDCREYHRWQNKPERSMIQTMLHNTFLC